MAQLALGVLGAVAGSALGGPLGASIGWSIGAAIGGLLDPPKVEGPRLTDLRLQQSIYGGMIPIPYGIIRLAGNVIDQTDLVEHKEKSGGKGGPEITNYTYSASFQVRLCEGPIAGVLRVWADKRLVYDVTQGSQIQDDEQLPFTLYLGDENQSPDPTFEAIRGVGNVPAYRGTAYGSFDALMLTDYGNRIPSIEWEVYTVGGGIPRRISSFDPWPGIGIGGFGGIIDPDDPSLVKSFTYNRNNNGLYLEYKFDLATGVDSGFSYSAGYSGGPAPTVIQNSDGWASSGGHWFHRGAIASDLDSRDYDPSGGPGIKKGNFYYYVTSNSTSSVRLLQFSVTDGVPALFPSAAFLLGGTASNWSVSSSDDAFVYVHETGSGTIYQLDPSDGLSLVYQWVDADYPSAFSISNSGTQIFRYHNFFAFGEHGLGFALMNLLQINGDHSLDLYPQDRTIGDLPSYDFQNGQMVDLGAGLVLGNDGVTSLNGLPGTITLADIVRDQSLRAGLLESDIDVSELTDPVDGYAVTTQQTCRANIEPLQSGFFFDAAEIDDVAYFAKRGRAPVFAIDENDLAAHVKGDEAPPKITLTRTQEVDLPARINVDYIQADADYQNGTQAAERQVTQSEDRRTIAIPVSMSDAKAKAVAGSTLFEAWFERDKGKVFVPRKYAKITPTDVGTILGRTWRVKNVNETPRGVIALDVVPTLAAIYTQPGAGAVSTGMSGGQTIPSKALTDLLLLDIPLLDDADSGYGFKAAMAPADAGAWSGASLQKSADGGTVYAEAASTTAAATKGTASNALGDYHGGNTVDEINMVEVVVNGELSGTTYAGLLNGERDALIGNEVMWFRDAELVDVDTYQLSGLLRGRYGTEWAMPLHRIGDHFVMLPALEVAAPSADLQRERLYKPVTFGKTLASADAVAFTNSGTRLKPLSPVQLGGGSDDSGNVTLNWNHRTRIGGAWADFVDVPLGETTEKYEVQIWDATYTQCARIIETTSPTASYSAADQVTDFGVEQQTIYFTVGQVGAIGLGRQASGSVPGIGSTDDAVLVPVTPYQNPTPPPVGVGSCAPVGDVLNGEISWTTPIRIYSGAFTTDDVWLIHFRTGASVAGSGLFAAAEFGGGPIARTAEIALSPCGAAIASTSGTSIHFDFDSGDIVLEPNTDYYIAIETSADGAMFADLIPNH